MKYLLDTNVLIYHLKGESLAVEFVRQHARTSCISFITVIEVLSFNHAKEERSLIEEFLATLPRQDIDEAIIAETVRLRSESKVKLPDCVIAATALTRNLALVTRNTKDFSRFLPGLRMVNPFE